MAELGLDPNLEEFISSLHFTVVMCGSRVTNPDLPSQDYDYLVFPEDPLLRMDDALSALVARLDSEGWKWEGDSEHYQTVARMSFMSWRKADVNLIVTTSVDFADKHHTATALCLRLNLKNKQDRIAVFQAVLYNRVWSK